MLPKRGFFRGWKVYKLARVLILNVTNKLRKAFLGKEKAKPDVEEFLTTDRRKDGDNKQEKFSSQVNGRIPENISSQQSRRSRPEGYPEKGKSADADVSKISELAGEYRSHLRYEEAEKLYKKALKLSPANVSLQLDLAYMYTDMYKFDEAEKIFLKVLRKEPDNLEATAGLVSLYVGDKPEHDKAKEIVKHWQEKFPDKYDTRILVAQYYQGLGRHDKAKDILMEAIKTDPRRFRAYYDLALINFHSGEKDKTLPLLKKALKRLDDNFSGEEKESLRSDCYFLLGRLYNTFNEYEKAEDVLKKIKEECRNSSDYYFILGEAYLGQEKVREAREHFLTAKRINPYKADYYFALKRCYDKQNKGKTYDFLKDNLVSNYRKIAKIVLANDIRLVCVQYPMCSVEPLKNILSGIEGITFVDNEEKFKRVVDRTVYGDYFLDRCGRVFGHATSKGNRLLAESIAETILKEPEGLER
ncbi:MAG: tetratricopeptide repeat protein [Candidatus Omnitrophica bacterium]|nr:tetratricopeptide repeat protein [Candidatus Omnitrophota bacterium]MBD3269820.1 tetratricopeptide repeat protein [Candidatus Omnitrophota bacterium]